MEITQTANPTVRELLDGSHTIDELRIEIHQVVTGLIGLVNDHMVLSWQRRAAERNLPPVKKWETEEIFCLPFPSNAWSVRLDSDSYQFVVEYWFPNTTNRDILAYRSWQKNKIEAIHVVTIHRNLQEFVDEMLNTFPELREAVQPLRNAAAYRKELGR